MYVRIYRQLVCQMMLLEKNEPDRPEVPSPIESLPGHLTSFASIVILVFSSRDTGQPVLALLAAVSNAF